MVSSPGNQAGGSTSNLGDPVTPAKSKVNWAAQVNPDLAFRLIDSILPFEACLYHQILPLSLEGSRLKLGMVNLDDSAALDYVRRILSYMNCSLAPHTISSEIHHAVLSAYLNFTVSQKKATSSGNPPQLKAPADPVEKRQDTFQEESTSKVKGSSVNQSTSSPFDRSNQPTLLVDSPEELSFQDLEVTSPSVPPSSVASNPGQNAPSELAVEEQNGYNPFSADTSQQPTFILKSEPPPAIAPPSVPPTPGDALPELDVDARHLSDPVEVLLTLPPAELLREVLGRVLIGGIGRLYLERQQNQGRILWSQNGVVQSVLEGLSIESLQGVISELKSLTRLPQIPIQKPKQVEIERRYQKHRLLLRLRVMPGTHGEEATVQVLRGAALKFYQQQQLAALSRDALNIAEDLQQKVNEIRVRTRFYPMLTADQLSILPALDRVVKSVEEQLDALKALQLTEANETDEGSTE